MKEKIEARIKLVKEDLEETKLVITDKYTGDETKRAFLQVYVMQARELQFLESLLLS